MDELPTYEDAIIQLYELINRWNNTKLRDGSTPADRFLFKNPNCKPMEPTVLRYLFGKHTEVDISYMRGFVNVYKTSGYSDYTQFQFEIPAYGGVGTELIAKATGYTSGAKVKVVWTEEMADLYTLDGKFIISCPPVTKTSQSHAEMTDEQRESLNYQKGRKRKQTEYIDEFEAELSDIINGLDYEQAMATGSNKEEFNAQMISNEQQIFNNSTKQRANRKFNTSEWSNLNE